jgi:hypothetical protein
MPRPRFPTTRPKFVMHLAIWVSHVKCHGPGFQQHDSNAYPQHHGCRPSLSTSSTWKVTITSPSPTRPELFSFLLHRHRPPTNSLDLTAHKPPQIPPPRAHPEPCHHELAESCHPQAGLNPATHVVTEAVAYGTVCFHPCWIW